MPMLTPPWCDTWFSKAPDLLIEDGARLVRLDDAVGFGASPWISLGALARLSEGTFLPLDENMIGMMSDAIEKAELAKFAKINYGVDGDAERWAPGNATAGRLVPLSYGRSKHPLETVRTYLGGVETDGEAGGEGAARTLGGLVRSGAIIQARVAAADRGARQPASPYISMRHPVLPQLQCLLYAIDGASGRPHSDVDVFMTGEVLHQPRPHSRPCAHAHAAHARRPRRSRARVPQPASTSASIGWHVDELDVLLLQLRGSKRFRVAGLTPGSAVTVDARLVPGDAVYVPSGHWHTGGGNDGGGHSLLLSIALSLPAALPDSPPTASAMAAPRDAAAPSAVAWRAAASRQRATFLELQRAWRGREAEVRLGDWEWAGTAEGAEVLAEWNERFAAAAAPLYPYAAAEARSRGASRAPRRTDAPPDDASPNTLAQPPSHATPPPDTKSTSDGACAAPPDQLPPPDEAPNEAPPAHQLS